MNDIREAIEAAKTISRQFSAFGQIADKADALLALVNHEDELKATIARLQGEIETLTTQVSEARLAEEQRTRDAKSTGDQTVADYEAKIATLDAELRAAKDKRNVTLQTVQAEADRGVRAINDELERAKTSLAAERQRVQTEHDEFIEQTKEHRARIEANTKTLEDKLALLRAQAKGALAAVEPTPQA